MKANTKLRISKSANVHSTAILLGKEIVVEDGVEIGPYCVIDGAVKIKKNVKLLSHVTVFGNTTIGEGTVIYPFASVGSVPQDLKYKGEKSFVEIGKNNTIREYVTINAGTAHGGLYTRLGDGNLLMISVHIGHDCKVGNNCIIANNVGIAGHVDVGDNVVIGGNSGIHQFVRIGKNAMIGGMSGVGVDVPPFSLYIGNRENKLRGLNIIGLKRHGFKNDEIKKLKEGFEFIFTNGNVFENANVLLKQTKNEKVKEVVNFILGSQSRRIASWDVTLKQDEQ